CTAEGDRPRPSARPVRPKWMPSAPARPAARCFRAIAAHAGFPTIRLGDDRHSRTAAGVLLEISKRRRAFGVDLLHDLSVDPIADAKQPIAVDAVNRGWQRWRFRMVREPSRCQVTYHPRSE